MAGRPFWDAARYFRERCCVDPKYTKSPALWPPADRPAAGPLYWWYARFRMVWEPETKPRWYLGPLLAHRVLRPVITDFSGRMPLWRFHRRAARDAAGHQFSFIFYATLETAAAVYERISRDPTLELLHDGHLLARVVIDDPGNPRKPDIGDTSDRHWSPACRKAGPISPWASARPG